MQRSNSSLQAQRDVFSSYYLFKIILNYYYFLRKTKTKKPKNEEKVQNRRAWKEKEYN